MTEETSAPELSASDRSNGMWCHLLGLSGILTCGLGAVGGPLIMWLMKKEESEWVDYHGKEAVNFGINFFAAWILCIPLTYVFIGLILMPAVGIGWAVFVIIASMKANEGVRYKYPFCLRIIK